MKRRWLEGVVVVVAALACVATSKPHWRLEATLLPEDIGRSRIIEVEASAPPNVMTADPSGTFGGERGIRPLGTHVWPGRNRFLISAGRPLEQVTLDGGPCRSSGCGSGPCLPPVDAKVILVSSTPARTWRLVAHGAAQSTVLAKHSQATIRVPIAHTHPIHVHLEPSTNDPYASVVLEGDEAAVTVINYTESELTVGWIVATDTEELCADPQVVCTPPDGAALTVGAPGKPTVAPF